jgi:hypothetical protein
VPAEYRTWLAERVAPTLARHGLDRQKGGAARKVDAAIATGVPGDEEVGFPAGSLPSGGMPGIRPKGDRPAPLGDESAREDPEQLALL